MWPESEDRTDKEQETVLRTGLTTGSCATACCVAAAELLLGGAASSCVTITLPSRKRSSSDIPVENSAKQVELNIISCERSACEESRDSVRAATIKDAGDDPDVTHGAEVFAEVTLIPEKDTIRFAAAKGVGTVTREGLALSPGEPAINPVPRQMMTRHLLDIAQHYKYSGGFRVEIGIVNGEALARKTMNPRLGILGGLSVLGTTGIVRPFSCAAYIASIHQGIDVASTNGYHHIAATTGNRSEQAVVEEYDLPDMALIEMGDFAGAVFKHLKKIHQNTAVRKLTLCGGFGKISKLAKGHMDLHSRASSIDLNFIAELAEEAGADAELCERIRQANTSIEALKLCRQQNIPLAEKLCTKALAVVQQKLPAGIHAEVWTTDRQGRIIARAGKI